MLLVHTSICMLFGYYFKRVIKFVIALGCVVKLGKAMFQLFVDEMSFLANFSCFQPHNIRMLYLFVRVIETFPITAEEDLWFRNHCLTKVLPIYEACLYAR